MGGIRKMKKKVLCVALTAVMGLSMATSAFAASAVPTTASRVGSGDVDGSGSLTANDASMIYQYVLDATYPNTEAGANFNLDEANYDGDIRSDNGKDQITANDCSKLLQDVLATYKTSVRVQAGAVNEEIPFVNEVINDRVKVGTKVDEATGKEVDVYEFTKTKVIDVVDKVFSGNAAYDAKLTDSVDKVNNLVDKIQFSDANGNTASIRDDQGWAKFEGAVEDVVTSEGALAQLKNCVQNTRYTNAEGLKEDYALLKAAFAPSESSDAIKAAADKVVAITGGDFITITKVTGKDKDGNLVLGETKNLTQIAETIAENNLQKYDDVTFDDLQDAFGNSFIITVSNPTSGYESQVKIAVVRE
jgi:hypothetical protein